MAAKVGEKVANGLIAPYISENKKGKPRVKIDGESVMDSKNPAVKASFDDSIKAVIALPEFEQIRVKAIG